ncbi:MAG: hypothetical protein R3F59_05635 [Myxococcota bacterium]
MIPLLLALGCHHEEPTSPTSPTTPADLGPPSGCDPLVPDVCGLPFPSSLFEAPDDTTPTGLRLAYGANTLPRDTDGQQVRPDMLNHEDGFSTLTPILVWFEGASTQGLVGHDDIGAYADPDVRTVVVDTVTHERVPHFVELDMSTDDPAQRVLTIRTAVPMEHARRYVVGLRNVVRDDGSPVDVSPAFAALRDGEPTTDPDVEVRRQRFEDLVFPELAQQGFLRDELQLAFDFGTISLGNSLDPVVAMRDDALARTDGAPPYRIDDVEEGDCAVEGEHIARTLTGHLTLPRYTEKETPPAKLVRDAAGMPVYQADTEVPFLVRIPCSIAADPGTGGRVLQYGHGLFGSLDEARGGYLAELADRNRWVLYAQTWTGMATVDAAAVTLLLATDVSDFEALPDRTTQGFSEFVAGARFARGALVDDPAMAFDGHPAVDPSLDLVYYGNSQGAILGGAYAALSPDIHRAVLGVGGTPYSLLLPRSADFEPFFALFRTKFDDHRDIALLLGAFQTVWDPGESAGYAQVMSGDERLPGTPEKRWLMQVGVGDAQVSTLGAHILARSVGAVTLAPAVRDIFGVPAVAGPVEGSVLVEWHYADGPEEPFFNLPPDKELDVHECPRREPAAQDQLSLFLETGVVEQFCDGACESVRAGLCD